MKQKFNTTSLSQEDVMRINGGQITKDTSGAYDFFYLVGLGFRSFYQFTVDAASFQSSLPPNLKK